MNICVYCASAMGRDEIHVQTARQTGHWIGQAGHRLVYGGACCGTMGVVADAAMEAGAEVHGIIPRFFENYSFEVVHPGLSQLSVVDSMAERKERMVKEADLFVCLPGSYGTLDELFETLALCQLKQIEKPVFLLNTQGFYDPLLLQLDKMQENGFLKEENRKLLQVVGSMEELARRVEEIKEQTR